MSRFLNSRLKDLEEYTPGEQPTDQKYIKLNTNESPYPPSPRVVEAIGEEEVKRLRLYSDPESRLLKAKLAETYRVRPENVFVANGSDEILNFAFMAYAQAGAAFPDLARQVVGLRLVDERAPEREARRTDGFGRHAGVEFVDERLLARRKARAEVVVGKLHRDLPARPVEAAGDG